MLDSLEDLAKADPDAPGLAPFEVPGVRPPRCPQTAANGSLCVHASQLTVARMLPQSLFCPFCIVKTVKLKIRDAG